MSASAAPHTCRACAAPVPEGALRCERCGAPQGDLPPCSHCRGQGGISPHAELRYVCDLCGGPRIPRLDPSIPASGREAPLLRKADEMRKARALWRGAGVASALALVLTVVPFLLLLIIVGAVPLLLLPGVIFTALFVGLLSMAVVRARAKGREIGPLLDSAWVAAATDIARSSAEPLSAQDLSRKLGIDEAQADELIALLDVQEAIGSGAVSAPRLRVGTGGAPAAAAPSEAAALSEAAEEEASAAEGTSPQRKQL